MAKIIENPIYQEDLAIVAKSFPSENLRNKSILVTGATGMIGSFLVDTLMFLNDHSHANMKIIACGRNQKRVTDFFEHYMNSPLFCVLQQDVREAFQIDGNLDYVIHCASNAHPVAYAEDPVGTMTTNFLGTKNVLDLCVEKKAEILFLSTFNVYGKNRGDITAFTEDYNGLLKIESRSCYPESKRSSETLCHCYSAQFGVNFKIARLSRVFGPTMIEIDSKASAQFFRNGVSGRDIVLKSDGKQYYSYIYTPDAVSAILYILVNGKENDTYNIANQMCNVHLADFANQIATMSGAKVVFDVQSSLEQKGSMNSVYDLMDNSKLQAIGWTPKYSLENSVNRTLTILANLKTK